MGNEHESKERMLEATLEAAPIHFLVHQYKFGF